MDELARSIVKWVSLRERSEFEVRVRLQTLETDASRIAQAIQALQQTGFLSKDRFIRAVVRDQLRKRKGPTAIVKALKQRHRIEISEWEIERIAEEEYLDFTPEAVQLLRRKRRQVRGEWPREKRLRFLLNRGYSMERAKEALHIFEHEEKEGHAAES